MSQSSQWRVIDFSFPEELPRRNQEIFFSMSAGEGKPFSATGRMFANRDCMQNFRDIMTREPGSIIVWQPCPEPPPVPEDYKLERRLRCMGTETELRRCVFCEEGYCIKADDKPTDEDYCGKQKPCVTLVCREVST